MIEVHQSVAALRAAVAMRRQGGSTVAFVPTMGSLHTGHLSLMRLAGTMADLVVVSVFVNPTQFNSDSDLETYPRDLAGDVALCEAEGVQLIFAPTPAQMYPSGSNTTVSVAEMTSGLCGASRPGHFDGVTTVVSKLLNIVRPDVAVFGEKDYQQLAVIRRMVRDLNMEVEIVGAPIVREADGLAMSSRNVHLKAEARVQALCLSSALERARGAVEAGEYRVQLLVAGARDHIEVHSLTDIDYIEVVDPLTLQPLEEVGTRGAVMALAVFVDGVRLIDNTVLDLARDND